MIIIQTHRLCRNRERQYIQRVNSLEIASLNYIAIVALMTCAPFLSPFQIVIILTDGNQTKTSQYTPLDVASQPLKDKKIRIVTVGVGAIDASQMAILSPDARDRFNPKKFEDLLPLVETMFSSGLCTGTIHSSFSLLSNFF